MKLHLSFVMIILISCNEKGGNSSESNLSLLEVESEINGNWRIAEIETKNRKWIPHSSEYTVEYFELNGLKGINGEIIYNKDGTIGAMTHQPACELKIKNGNILIEFIGLTDWTEMKILKLSNNEMILTDSTYTVTYIRDEK